MKAIENDKFFYLAGLTRRGKNRTENKIKFLFLKY